MVIKRSSKRSRKEQTVQHNEEETQPSAPPSVDGNLEQLIVKLTGEKQKEKQPVIVFAHGAGAPSSSDWMQRWKGMLAEALNAIEVVTFDYPYITGKKRWVPPKAEKLVEHHRDMVKKTMDKYPGHPLVLAGKSMGSRVSCMVAGEKDMAVSAVVCLGYPLKGVKGAVREETLLQLTVPVMFVQGTKDGLCSLEKLEDIRKKMNAVTALHVIEGGDHCFKITQRDLLSSGSSQEEAEDKAVQAISKFVSSSLGESPTCLQQPALSPPPPQPACSLWHMETPPRSQSPSSSRTTTTPPQITLNEIETRQTTRRKNKIKKKCVVGEKLPLDIDEVTGKIKRIHQVKLSSYQGKLARQHVSILYDKWKHVPEDIKNKIWEEILARFEIIDTEKMKKKILQEVGVKWSHFKTQLTSYWIYGENKDLSPCEQYNIPQNEWDEFKKSRLDPAWQERRKRAQETQKWNTTPQTLSRGGYDLLVEKIMAEKLKKRLDEAADSDAMVEPPSPPKRHETFKLARMRKTGEMTSDAAREIAKRIDELEKQAADGSFVPEGRQDILAAALGRPEHPGRVRGVGGGIGTRDYFGPMPHAVSQEFLERLTLKITQEVTENMVKEFGPAILTLGAQSQQTPAKEHTPHVAPVSRNGSCVAPVDDLLGEEAHNGISDRCGLYIDERPPRLVAIGRVHEGGSALHGVPLSGDLVRVSVEDVRDGLAPVPQRTAEVSLVGQALGGFIAWPRHLIKPITAEDIEQPKKRVGPVDRSEPHIEQPKKRVGPVDRSSEPHIERPKKRVGSVDRSSEPHIERPKKRVGPVDRSTEPQVNNLILELLNIAPSLYNKPLRVAWDAGAFGVENDNPFYIHHKEVLEVFQGNVGLSMSILQLWVIFLNSLSVGTGNDDLYGFFEPQSIQNMGDKRQEATMYMKKHMQDSKKPIYLGAYQQEKNWQLLVLLPKEGVAVWFCSQHRKPDPDIKVIVQGLVTQFNALDKHRKKSNEAVCWVYPKCNKQDEGWECGYYVMHWMWSIVRIGIKDNWAEVFCDDDALPSESIEKIRTQWARYFFEVKNRQLLDN